MVQRSFFFILLGLSFLSLFGCSHPDKKALPGYIEGEYTYIAGGIAGTLLDIQVVRGQPIKKNDFLYRLDPEPDLAFMQAAKANIEQLEPQVAFAKVQLSRQQKLYLSNASPKSSLDEAQKDYDTLLKQIASAQKSYTQAQWAAQQKTIYSPVTGQVFDVFYRLGEKVIANQPVLAILTPDHINVLFYVPEKELSTVHLGQMVSFTCDGCRESTNAQIVYISPEAEYTPPIIYSADTRYKLVYLIRATMPPNIAKHFHPGQPIDVYQHG